MESAPQKKKTRQIQELPFEIWSQILLCIPAITVIQLKMVCKRWFELINSNHFRISHVDHWRIRDNTQFMSKCQSSVLLTDLVDDDKVFLRVSRPLRFDRLCFRRSQHRRLPSTPMETAVLDCCDGLFLVRLFDQYLFLCNPLTNSYIPLPFPERKFLISHSWTVVYDPSTRGYVIFCAEHTYLGNNSVSSLRVDLNGGGGHGQKSAKNWRKLWSSQNLTQTIFVHYIASYISINGKAHWLFFFHDIHEYEKKTGILTINASTEESTFSRCSYAPHTRSDFFTNGRFFASNRKFYYLTESRETLELWAIEDVDNPTWLKHHVIIKMDILPNKMDLYNFSLILKEGNRLIIRTRDSRDMFIYDISLKKWQTIDIVDPENLCRGHELKFMSKSISYSLLSW